MKPLFSTLVLALALAWALGVTAQQATTKNSHLGTWELISFKYGDDKDFSDFPKVQRRLKLITETHFTWVQYAPDGKKVEGGVAGGPCSLNGDTYTETIEFAGEGMADYLGKKHTFKIRVEGDKFFLSGQLADGLKIEEVWRRVK